jgi:phosphoketolase
VQIYKNTTKQKRDFSPIKKYLRVVNYLSAAQLYIKDNFFLERGALPEEWKNWVQGPTKEVAINMIEAILSIS